MSKRYTEGIAGDGAAILDNGIPVTITEILNRLNDHDELVKESDSLPNVSDQRKLLIKYESWRSTQFVLWDEDEDNVDAFLDQ